MEGSNTFDEAAFMRLARAILLTSEKPRVGGEVVGVLGEPGVYTYRVMPVEGSDALEVDINLEMRGFTVVLAVPVDCIAELREPQHPARPVLARTVGLVLRQDRDRAFDKLTKELDDARRSLQEAQAARNKALREFRELEAKHEALNTEREKLNERLDDCQRRESEARTHGAKLEGDLGKVRTAIGTKAYAEIVGA